jgi:TLD
MTNEQLASKIMSRKLSYFALLLVVLAFGLASALRRYDRAPDRPPITRVKKARDLSMKLIDSINLGELLKGTTLAGQQLEMIYSGARDGWDAKSFHLKVDYDPPVPSLVVCKTKSNVICGAYNALGWQTRDDYRDSLRTFLFRAVGKNSVERATKLPGSPALYDFADRAVWFAEGLCIPLNGKFMSVRKGRSSLSTSFSSLSPSGDSCLFPGDQDISELEVYASSQLVKASRLMLND